MTSQSHGTEPATGPDPVEQATSAGTSRTDEAAAFSAPTAPSAPTVSATAPSAGSAETPRGPAGADPEPTGHSPAPRRAVRLTTVVWGAILLAIGATLLAIAAGATVDLQLALIVGLAAAGLALLVGSLVATVKRSNRSSD